jgi:hypothetical protein
LQLDERLDGELLLDHGGCLFVERGSRAGEPEVRPAPLHAEEREHVVEPRLLRQLCDRDPRLDRPKRCKAGLHRDAQVVEPAA